MHWLEYKLSSHNVMAVLSLRRRQARLSLINLL